MAKQEKIGVFEAIKEGVQAIAPGLSLEKMWADVKHEAVEQTKHSAHELSACLFTGSSFVMYAKAGKENNEQSKDNNIEVPNTPSMEKDSERER